VSRVDVSRLVADKADFALSDREQVIPSRGVGLMAAEARVHHRGVRRPELAGYRRSLVVVAHQAELGLGCHKLDSCPRFTNNYVVARRTVIFHRRVDVGCSTQQIAVAAGALGGLQADQARVLDGRTFDRNHCKRHGCGSCPSRNPIVGDIPHALSLVGISTAILSRRPHFSEAQSTYLLHSIQQQPVSLAATPRADIQIAPMPASGRASGLQELRGAPLAPKTVLFPGLGIQRTGAREVFETRPGILTS
jgi:hypothetical protein